MSTENRAELCGAETRDEYANFIGYTGRECGEHRTVGEHRAWCFGCTEYCYPGGLAGAGPCKGCELPMLRLQVEQLTAVLDVLAQLCDNAERSTVDVAALNAALALAGPVAP